jgi:hypothetical protein
MAFVLEAKFKPGGLPCYRHSHELFDQLRLDLKDCFYLRKIFKKAAMGMAPLFFGFTKHERTIA